MTPYKISLSEIIDKPAEFRMDEWVQAHPGTDCWMMGDRYGTVVFVGRKLVHVRMERSNKVRRFHPSNLLHG